MINTNEMKKGISPLIATILLIAFVVIIATGIFVWGGEFSKGVITGVQEKEIQMNVMAQGDIKILGSKLMSGNRIEVEIENVGSITVGSFTASITGTDGSIAVTIADSLNPLNIKKYIFEYGQNIGSIIDIKIIPIYTYDSNGVIYNPGSQTKSGGFVPLPPPSGLPGGSSNGAPQSATIQTVDCTSNDECADDEICASEICLKVACFSDYECGAGELCKSSGTEMAYCGCDDNTIRNCGMDLGACEYGSQTCFSDKWSTCDKAINPVTEECDDGLDNDCDGYVDEGCACATNGESESAEEKCCAGLESIDFSEITANGDCDNPKPADCDIIGSVGTCKSVVVATLYYYNAENNACDLVEWANCADGVLPPFETVDECEQSCIKKTCINCGDSYCGPGENSCNCADDCPNIDYSCNTNADCKVAATSCSCCGERFGCVNVEQGPIIAECNPLIRCMMMCPMPPTCACVGNTCEAVRENLLNEEIIRLR